VGVAALGESAASAGGKGNGGDEPGNCEVTQDCILKLKHSTTHKFPDDCLPAAALIRNLPDPQLNPNLHRVLAGLMPFKWVPNAAETLADSHDGHFGFCPANSQLYRVVVKPRPDFGVSWW
jgi:hypothetical protein